MPASLFQERYPVQSRGQASRIVLLSAVLLVLVIPHIVSADTLIVYTSGNEDGYIERYGTESFTDLREGDGLSVDTTSATSFAKLQAKTTTDIYAVLDRAFVQFNTSSIPDTGYKIDSTILILPGHGTKSQTLGTTSVGITGFSPATPGTAETGDFDTFGNVRYASDIAGDSWSISTNNTFTFNEAGLANISKVGYTPIMIRVGWDINNDLTGASWCSWCYNQYVFMASEHSGSNDPCMQIVFSQEGGVSAPVASFTASKNFIRIPNLISVTDTSTNTPTSWEWSWGDGSANSTTQNPTHQYKKRGRFPIVLTATNAGGSGSTAAYNVRVAGYEN